VNILYLHKSIQNSKELTSIEVHETSKNYGIIMCYLVQIFIVCQLIFYVHF